MRKCVMVKVGGATKTKKIKIGGTFMNFAEIGG